MKSPNLFGIFLGVIATLGVGCSSAYKPKPLSDEERAAIMIQSAYGALNTGESSAAMTDILEAEKLDSKNPEVFHLKGIILASKGEAQMAEASLRKALEINPKYSVAKNTLGKFLVDQSRYVEAEPLLREAAEDLLFAESYKSSTLLGILKYRQKDFENASREFNRAIQLSSQQACIAYYYRGHIHLKGSNFKAAAEDYARASRLSCAGFSDAHYAQGLAYLKDQQMDLARKKFLEIQKLFPRTKAATMALQQLRGMP